MSTTTQQILERLGGERRINYDLWRFLAALEDAGSPQKSVNSVIVSGTNGKGSVSLFLSSALALGGRRVTTLMSPHLQHVEERFLHNLIPIEASSLRRLAEEHFSLAEKHDLTYFEYLTLLYFMWAKETRSDISVLEVGLGGRLDATNVTSPLACVLTNISYDHQAFLGDTLPEILNEKMGTFRHKIPVYSNLQSELRPLLERRCFELETPVDYPDFLARSVESRGWEGQTVRIDGHRFFLHNPSPAALENATLAYLVLRMSFPDIAIETIQTAFASVVNPGRLETVARSPRVVLSGDHNPAGIESLLESVKEVHSGKLHVVCAFSPDKPYREMLAELQKISSTLRLTCVPRLKGKMPEGYSTLAPYFEDPTDAIDDALKTARPDDVVLVTGSLYLIGAVRATWHPTARFISDLPNQVVIS